MYNAEILKTLTNSNSFNYIHMLYFWLKRQYVLFDFDYMKSKKEKFPVTIMVNC